MTHFKFRGGITPALAGIAALAALVAGTPAQAAIQVDVNGRALRFADVQPVSMNGRVFLPLRDVAEALDADVRWNAATQTVHGSRDGRTFRLPIGSRTAFVQDNSVSLDSPARLVSGRTLVPLRFAAEALGAEVAWHPANQRVAIDLPGGQPPRDREVRDRDDRDRDRDRDDPDEDRVGRRVIPAHTVVQVSLDEELSSKTARVGDRFTATLDRDDKSRFPEGTRFSGRITEAKPSTKDRPGVIDASFSEAVLPDGRTIRISGSLAGLDGESIRRTADGRLESKKSGQSKFDWKWVGVGAAGGAVLGGIFGDDDWLKGALLGSVGGAVYAYLNKGKDVDKRQRHDVVLEEGTKFGVVLDRQVALNTQR
jgi:hypothetical protein